MKPVFSKSIAFLFPVLFVAACYYSFKHQSTLLIRGLSNISIHDGKKALNAVKDNMAKRAPGNIDFIIEDSVLIHTRDGATISATIVRKKDLTTPQPVILTFTIYPNPFDKNIAMAFAARDFVGVVANTRGKRLSPQPIEPFEHDADDAFDIIEWISKQTWCNGKIGMYGGSYAGFSTWAATKKMHPALKTIVPMVSTAPGIDIPKFNGVYRSFYSLAWIHRVTDTKADDIKPTGTEKRWDSVFKVWYHKGSSFRSLDTIEGRPNNIFQRWLQHPAYDSYWSEMIPQKEEYANINIPVLSITGYYDGDQIGALHYFHEHHKYNTHADHYLIIGPYDHGAAQSMAKKVVDEYTIDSVARVIFFPVTVIHWFNYILKDSTRPSLLKDKINYQVMGTNKWKHVANMNEINNDTLTFYLSNLRSGIHYKLLLQQPVSNQYIESTIDFKKRNSQEKSWKIIDSNFNQYKYLSFITDPLDEPLSVNGRYFADLSFIINKKDVDLEMEMLELMPDGRYFLLSTEYLVRASFANDPSKRQLLQPGHKETIPVRNTFFTSKQLSKGSRLVILIGVPSRIDWQINYGTGKDVSDETIADDKTPLEIKLLSSSWIKIPVYKDRRAR